MLMLVMMMMMMMMMMLSKRDHCCRWPITDCTSEGLKGVLSLHKVRTCVGRVG